MQLADPDRHHISVSCRIENPAPQQALSLPSWIPGSYLLREFARHIVSIDAQAGGVPVALQQTAKGTWVAQDAAGPLVVTITVLAHDLSVRGAWFDRERAFFNGTSLFLRVDGRADDPVELVLETPAHAATAGWQVATAMRASRTDTDGFGTYVADNYDELIDHPFEIGHHEVIEFDAGDVPHRFVIAGRFDADTERLASDLRQLCTAQIDFFGRPAPFSHYTFLGLAVGDGYGGLEHRASSSLIFKRANLPRPGEPGMPVDYQGFLALCSHEYFHSWHVKRSKPAAFMPFRLDRRNHTRLLWVFEGITSYYQENFLLRSGLLGSAAYLRRIGELLTRVYRVPGRHRQSLAASSFNAWDRLYKPDAHSINTGVSYYSKGAMVALALDLLLRRGGAALDDVVRELWNRYGRRDIGLPEDGFEALAAGIGGEPAREFLAAAVDGTEDPDLESLFADCGLLLKFRQGEGAQDRGGTPPKQTRPRVGIGAVIVAHPAGLKLSMVPDGQPAQAAGLAPEDVIIALDRIQVNPATLESLLSRYDAGDQVTVSYFRGDELHETELRLEWLPLDHCYIEMAPEADAAQLQLRRAWLGE